MTALTWWQERERAQASAARDDVVAALTVFAVVQMLLPESYVIGPLGAAGAPARLIGLGIALWWLADWLGTPWPRSHVRQPLRWWTLALLGAVWTSYLVAAIRPTNEVEQLPADRAVLNVIAFAGIIFAAMDGIRTLDGLDTLLRRLTLLGAAEAAFGLLQFLTGQSFIQYLHVPGLQDQSGIDEELGLRGSFFRSVGTASHPIEFGITLAMLLPLALHFAVADAGRRSRATRWVPVCLIATALTLALSRAAIVCVAVGLLVLLPSWPRDLRRSVYTGGLALTMVLAAVLPGFLRTFLNLFSAIGADSSTTSRTNSYQLAWSFFSREPVFGRGMGTFLPRYRILDNQYLVSLIEVGIVGTVCLVVVFVISTFTACRLGSRAHAPGQERPRSSVGRALGSAIAGGAVSFAFFDAWGFAMIPSMLALLLGSVGASRRLTLEGALVEART